MSGFGTTECTTAAVRGGILLHSSSDTPRSERIRGRYDPRFSIDGLSTPVVIPPAYGLAGVAKETFTGDGDVSYWNNYVAVTQMGGQGVFVDPRLDIKIIRTPDRVHGKLPDLLAYQLSLPTNAGRQ